MNALAKSIFSEGNHWLRWTFVVLAGYVLITYVTTKTYPQARYLHVKKVAAGVYEALDDASYRGENTVIGWPIRWLGYRREATSRSVDAPLKMIAVKTSMFALGLDLLAVAAVIVAGVQIRLVLRERFRAVRVVVIVLCLIYVGSMPFVAERNFLGRIPVYADDSES